MVNPECRILARAHQTAAMDATGVLLMLPINGAYVIALWFCCRTFAELSTERDLLSKCRELCASVYEKGGASCECVGACVRVPVLKATL